MDKIEDVKIISTEKSDFVKPFSLQYKQNGKLRKWDLVSVHDSVAILIYHREKRAFIFVKQFRPAVYINRVTVKDNNTVDTNKYDGNYGITYELCAGIMDKNSSPEETARDEVLEECGFDIPVDKLVRITMFSAGVGIAGASQTMFYLEVDDTSRVHEGGGLHEEGEILETVEVSIDDAKSFIMDETKPKTVGLMFAVMWFYDQKSNSKL